NTDVPELRVDPALYAAAARVQNGELVPEPISEGDRFAVVWRRGSLQPVSVSLDEARSTIERLIAERKIAERCDALVEQLSKAHVKERHDALLERVAVPAL